MKQGIEEGSNYQSAQCSVVYREVQLDFTPEMEVFHIMF